MQLDQHAGSWWLREITTWMTIPYAPAAADPDMPRRSDAEGVPSVADRLVGQIEIMLRRKNQLIQPLRYSSHLAVPPFVLDCKSRGRVLRSHMRRIEEILREAAVYFPQDPLKRAPIRDVDMLPPAALELARKVLVSVMIRKIRTSDEALDYAKMLLPPLVLAGNPAWTSEQAQLWTARAQYLLAAVIWKIAAGRHNRWTPRDLSTALRLMKKDELVELVGLIWPDARMVTLDASAPDELPEGSPDPIVYFLSLAWLHRMHFDPVIDEAFQSEVVAACTPSPEVI